MSVAVAAIPIRIIIQGGPAKSTRDRELDDAANRSHAARVFHARRRRNGPAKAVSTVSDVSGKGRNVNPVAIAAIDGSDPDRGDLMDLHVVGHSSTSQFLIAPRKPDLLKGNSDPFSSFPVKITPQINQTLTFMRDAVFPNIYYHNKFMSRIHDDGSRTVTTTRRPNLRGDSDHSTWISASIGHQAWGQAVESLHGEGVALACIASYMGNMAMLMTESSKHIADRLSLTLATRSSFLLRNALATCSADASASASSGLDPAAVRDVTNQVYYLYRASVVSGDKTSIDVYGGILKLFMLEGIMKGAVDIVMLFQAGVDDIDVSAKFMCRPLFDYSWFHHVASGLWSMAEPGLPVLEEDFAAAVFTGLHENVESEELRAAFMASRHMNAYAERPLPHDVWGSALQKRLAYSWFATKSLWAIGATMNIYLDLRDDEVNELSSSSSSTTSTTSPSSSSSSSSSPPKTTTTSTTTLTPGQRLTQAALALALVYQYRFMGHTTTVNGVDIRDCSASIMAHLQCTMTGVFTRSTADELRRYRDAHLWVLFQGALWERRVLLGPGAGRQFEMGLGLASGGGGGWFQSQLVERAVAASSSSSSPPAACSWDTFMRPVLERFAYSDWDGPNGSTWFDDSVVEFCAREHRRAQAEVVLAELFA